MHLNSKRHNLNNSWASNGVVIGDSSGVGGQDSERLASRAINANRDSDSDHAVLDNGGREHGASCQREGDEQRASRNLHVSGDLEGDELALHDGHGDVLGHAESGEGLDGEHRVGSRARLDEGSGKRVDLVEVEGNVERLGEGRLIDVAADEGVVAGFDGQNAAGCGEVSLVGDESGGAEVGAHTDTLDDGCGGQEGCRSEVAKVVCALFDGCDASSLQGGGQEVDVGLLIAGNHLEVLVEVGLVEACSSKVLCGEVGKCLAVEGGLEVLKGQGVVQDSTAAVSQELIDIFNRCFLPINVRALALDESRCSRSCGGQDGGADD